MWEILSPSPDLHAHVPTYRRLARLYAAVRNAYAKHVNYAADLANKTRHMVQESAIQEWSGDETKTVTFDVETLEALRNEPGSDEAKVFNLIRGLRREMEDKPHQKPILLPLQERAERVRQELEERKTNALAAMRQLSLLAEEKEDVVKAAQDSGLSPRAFGVHWTLKDDAALKAAGIPTLDLAREVEALLDRYPNATLNADERRRLRGDLYRPLLRLTDAEERSRIVERMFAILSGADVDAGT